MNIPIDVSEGDRDYFEDDQGSKPQAFDASLLEEGLHILPARPPLVFSPSDTVRKAMAAMQSDQRGCVLITEDGTKESRLIGIFTERDILFRIVDGGRDPETLPLRDVMTTDPETVPSDGRIAWVLNQMAVGGFRHVPVVDDHNRVQSVISVRDVVHYLVEFFPAQILNLPPKLRDTHPTQREGA